MKKFSCLLTLSFVLLITSCSSNQNSSLQSISSNADSISSESSYNGPVTSVEMEANDVNEYIYDMDTSLDSLVKANKCEEDLNFKVNEACFHDHEEEYVIANGHTMIYDDAYYRNEEVSAIYDNKVSYLNVEAYEQSYIQGSALEKKDSRFRTLFEKEDGSIYWSLTSRLNPSTSFGDTYYTAEERKSLGSEDDENFFYNVADPIGLNSNVKNYFETNIYEYGNDFLLSGTSYSDGSYDIKGSIKTESILYYLPVVWENTDQFSRFDIETIVYIDIEASFNNKGICTEYTYSEQWYMDYSPIDGLGFDETQYLYGTKIHYYDISTDSQGNYTGELNDYGDIVVQ